jgi:prephenate dehydrogenase
MTDLHFRQISILGVGLLGGSLGLAVRRAGLADTVVGVGHRESTLRAAKDRGAIDRYTLSAAEGAAGADLLVLATPVGLFAGLLRDAAPALAPGCLITDVGSTKRAVLESVSPLVPAGCRFVGSHPLAGSETRGITAAHDNLYSGALVLITPTPYSDEASLCRTEQFWQALGSRTRRLDAATHDRLLAQTSHLPHLIAAALVESLSTEAAPLVARGFLDTTRIASGDPAMWQDIFLTNRDEVLAALDRFQAILAQMKSALSDGDSKAIREFLDRAKQSRDGLLK